MWSKYDLDSFMTDLKSNQREKVASWLVVMMEGNDPTCNEDVVSMLEELLTDTRACVVRGPMPPVYGQIRWLAARVLVLEYACLGKAKSLILDEVAEPVYNNEFLDLMGKYNRILKPIMPRYNDNNPYSYERFYIAFEELVRRGIIPLRKIEFISPD